jgi:PAS domain S-box-containing protein
VQPLSALLALVADMPVMISIFGPDGQIRAVNPAWERVLGWTQSELLSEPRDILQACFPDPTEHQRARAFVTAPWSGWVDFAPLGRDGQTLQTTWANTRLPDGTIMCLGHLVTTPHQRPDTERAQLLATIQVMQAQVHALSRQLLRAQEMERQRIAREMHDEIGQQLTGIGMLLARLSVGLPSDSRALLAQVDLALRHLLDRVRALSLDLRPALLDDFGLASALYWYREHIRSQTGLQVVLSIDGLGERLDREVELAGYRIVQEGLTNVVRHAQAAIAYVHVWCAASTLHIQITDHGRGFDIAATLAAPKTSGLLGMRERAAGLGGELRMTSTRGVGTVITAALPLRQHDLGGERQPATVGESGEQKPKQQADEEEI